MEPIFNAMCSGNQYKKGNLTTDIIHKVNLETVKNHLLAQENIISYRKVILTYVLTKKSLCYLINQYHQLQYPNYSSLYRA